MTYRGRGIITEGSRDKQLSVYLPFFEKRGINLSLSQLKQFLLRKFVNEAGMHNLSLDSNYYLAGVAKYYFNGDLTSNKRLNAFYPNVSDKFNNEVCARLDALINVLRNSYIDSVGTKWEQPEDFGEMTIDKLLKKYNRAINKELGIGNNKTQTEGQKMDNDRSAGKDYDYEVIMSYSEMTKYKEYTEPGAWCVTYGRQHFDGYIKRLGIHYVVFRRSGFENVAREKGPGFTPARPHDEYGNSLICVLQSNDGPEPKYITSRWNHGTYREGTSCEADHAYTTEEFLQTIGCDYSVLERCYLQWKQLKKKSGSSNRLDKQEKMDAARAFKYAQMKINSGQKAEGAGLTLHVIGEKNGLFSASMEVGGKTYETVYRRGKLFFDDILTPTSGRMFVDASELNYDVVVVSKNKYKVFDVTRNCFLDIDGTKTFNATRDGGNLLFVSASSNQKAVILTDKMRPIAAKNGSHWFEEIFNPSYYSSRSINNLPYMGFFGEKNETTNLALIYDNSSLECYLYCVNNGRLTEISDMTRSVGGNIIHSTSGGNIIIRGFAFGAMLVNAVTHKPIEILGNTIFMHLVEEFGVAGFCPLDSDFGNYYDIKRGEILKKPDGSPITAKIDSFGRGVDVRSMKNFCSSQRDLVFVSEKIGGRSGYIYDTESGKLIDIDGGYLFSVSFYTRQFVTTETGRTVLDPYKEYIAQHGGEQKNEDVRKEFFSMLKRIDEARKLIW